MKRLVLCFDGTWSALGDPTALTNVVKLANLVTVSHEGVSQITYYNSGVGTGGPIDRLLGGAFGYGLKSNVKRGLSFLALNWEAGDEIYLFGFSRGAYTARSLCGFIKAAGLLDKPSVKDVWRTYMERYVMIDHASARVVARPSGWFTCMRCSLDESYAYVVTRPAESLTD